MQAAPGTADREQVWGVTKPPTPPAPPQLAAVYVWHSPLQHVVVTPCHVVALTIAGQLEVRLPVCFRVADVQWSDLGPMSLSLSACVCVCVCACVCVCCCGWSWMCV